MIECFVCVWQGRGENGLKQLSVLCLCCRVGVRSD